MIRLTLYSIFRAEGERVHDLPSGLMKLAKILEEQPVFKGQGFILDERGSKVKKYKVIALPSYAEACICGIFNDNSRRLLGDTKSNCIHKIDDNNCALFDSNEERIRHGISLWLDDQIEMCSHETLKESYDKVFSAMISGWKKADVEDYPDMIFKEDPTEFELFIKDRTLIEEEVLIRFVAAKFFKEGHVVCQNEWSKPEGFYYSDIIYLWVKKTELSRAVEKMGFILPS